MRFRGWGHSFAADDAEPSHHIAQENPQPCAQNRVIRKQANPYYSLYFSWLRMDLIIFYFSFIVEDFNFTVFSSCIPRVL